MAKSTRKISVYTHIIDLLKQSRIMILNILVCHIRFEVGNVYIFCVRRLEQIEEAADVLLHQILLSAVPDYLYFVGCHPIEVLRELLCFRKDLFFNFCLGFAGKAARCWNARIAHDTFRKVLRTFELCSRF